MPGRQKRPLIEESGPSVTHVDISRLGKRRTRKKRETEYSVADAIASEPKNDTDDSQPPGLGDLPGIGSHIIPTVASHRMSSEPASDWHSENPFNGSLATDPSSDFAMSDGPELFNGLADPEDKSDDEKGDLDAHSMASEEHIHHHHLDPKSRKRKRTRETAMEKWIPFRQEYLERLMIRDAKSYDGPCTTCGTELEDGARYRCCDCLWKEHKCSSCMLSDHANNPFHRLEQWNGRFWKASSLGSLGYQLRLGHYKGSCETPLKREELTILHVNGSHKLVTIFCGCREVADMEPRNQLLEVDLYPASALSPSTAITIACLDTFINLSEQSSLSTYDYYQAMRHMTDGIGVSDWPKRYDELSHVVRSYRHLMMLKRGGRGHDPQGVNATTPGELAVACPACPHPGKNLPRNYESAPYWKRYLYDTFWSMDANFRLKRKARGTREDLYLSPNWGYFVHPNHHERERIRPDSVVEKEDRNNSCESTFAAIERANSKGLEGYHYTGVGAVICSRHSFLQPSVVNLKKGKRQLDMDLSLLSSVRRSETGNRRFRLTYDIACRWGIHLWRRIPLFNDDYSKPIIGSTFILGVPKFHLPGHGRACHSVWSLNFRLGWARTDGEGIERFWSIVNRFATASREMTSGSRHDFLDYQINAVNFRKLTSLGSLLHGKLKDATAKIQEHSIVLRELDESCGAEQVTEWKKQVAAWQEDQTVKPDPYQEGVEATTSKSLAQLRKEMAKEEADALNVQAAEINASKMTATAFLLQGIDLEASQFALKTSASRTRQTAPAEEARVEERRTSLLRKIRRWIDTQAIYMPQAFAYRHSQASSKYTPPARVPSSPDTDTDTDDEAEGRGAEDIVDPELEASMGNVPAEDYPLYLPSGLPEALLRVTAGTLKEKESRIRLALLESTLYELRRLLRVRMGITNNKRSFVVGQKGNTRAQKLLKEFEDKISDCANRYRDIRKALLTLDPTGEWASRLRILKDDDVCPPQGNREPDSTKGSKGKKRTLGEGSKQISWIWRVSDTSDLNDQDNDMAFGEAMRVEWAKADARVTRWSEEKELVMEEMRRTPWYLEWKAKWWESKAQSRNEAESPLLRDACSAYATKQANICRALSRKFTKLWQPLLNDHKLILTGDWPLSSLNDTDNNTRTAT